MRLPLWMRQLLNFVNPFHHDNDEADPIYTNDVHLQYLDTRPRLAPHTSLILTTSSPANEVNVQCANETTLLCPLGAAEDWAKFEPAAESLHRQNGKRRRFEYHPPEAKQNDEEKSDSTVHKQQVRSSDTSNRKLNLELKRLKQECKRLRAEKKNCTEVANNAIRSMKIEMDGLQARVGELTKSKKELQEKVTEEKRLAEDASREKSQLLQMLQLAAVNRKDVGSTGAFPNGSEITKLAKNSRKTAEDVFLNLADMMSTANAEAPSSASSDESYRYTLTSILQPCFKYAQFCYDFCVDKQTMHFADFLVYKNNETVQKIVDGKSSADGSLESLGWFSAMQKNSMEFVHSLEHVNWLKQVCMMDDHPPKEVLWALDSAVADHEEMECVNLQQFMNQMMELSFYARFSQPRCYLHPLAVGETTAFSPDHHTQVYIPAHRQKAKSGESVHILYPGLYFDDPDGSEVVPVVKGLVVKFPSSK